jgi:hypothetical protein
LCGRLDGDLPIYSVFLSRNIDVEWKRAGQGGVASKATASLLWNNPCAAGKALGLQATANRHGVYVEVTTEFSCSPGLVCTWEGPAQVSLSLRLSYAMPGEL